MKSLKIWVFLLAVAIMMFGCTNSTSPSTTQNNSTKAITSFVFSAPAVEGTITESTHTIAVSVPFGTDVKALVPNITYTGASVNPNSGIAQDFTNQVAYTVTAADASTQNYTVTVSVIPAASFTVTFDSQDAKVEANPVSKVVTEPAMTVGVLPTDPSKTGFSFAGWYTATNGGGTAFSSSTLVTGNITVYAYWSTNPVYFVTYNSDDGTSVGSQFVTLPATTVGALPTAPTKTGYTFSGWYTAINGGGTAFDASTTVTSDITVFVNWNSYSYVVSFDSQSATIDTNPITKTVSSPATTIGTLPADPSKTGYIFGGWYTATNGGGAVVDAASPVVSDITVYAKWNSYSYMISFDGQSATIDTNPVTKTVRSPATTIGTLPTNPSKTGYIFGGWYAAKNGGGEVFSTSSIITSDISVYAKWNNYSYTVSFNSQSATVDANPVIKTVSSPETTAVTLPSPPIKTGFSFAGWYTAINGGGTAFSSSTLVTGDITVYAYWSTNPVYCVTYNSDNGTSVGSQFVTSPAITVSTLPTAPSKTGYLFDGWYTAINGGGAAFDASTTVASDISVFAKWNSYSYVVSFDSQSASIAASPTSETVSSPSTTAGTLPIVPKKSGYIFGGWYTAINGGGAAFDASTTVTSDITVFAKWNSYSYVVSFDSQSATVLANPTTKSVFSPDTTVGTLPVSPIKPLYTFDGWYTAINGQGTVFNASTTVTSDITVFANWIITPPAIPSDVVISAGNHKNIISWSPVATATSYNIYWSNSSGVTKATGTLIADISSPYAQSSLINGNTYYYIVTAVNGGGESLSSNEISSTPVGVRSVSAGVTYTMIVKLDGSLWGTGQNIGQFGVGGTPLIFTLPVQVISSGVKAVSTFQRTMIVKTDGSLWDTGGEILTSGVQDVSVGNHTMILKTDGSLWAYGDNAYGQLGDGTLVYKDTPVQILSNGVQAVSAGASHTMILKSDGSLWACGWNTYGQLGDGTTTNRKTLVQILASGVQAVCAGYFSSMILKTDGSLWSMGDNYYGELGDGTNTNRKSPVKILDSGVQAISIGQGHAMFIKNDGSLWAIGKNDVGQLGDGTLVNRNSPVQVIASGVQAVALGQTHTMVIINDGIWATGSNSYGQLGDGTTINKSTLFQVQ